MGIQEIMWKMRIRQQSTLEHYLQEVAAATSLRDASRQTRSMIEILNKLFDRLID